MGVCAPIRCVLAEGIDDDVVLRICVVVVPLTIQIIVILVSIRITCTQVLFFSILCVVVAAVWMALLTHRAVDLDPNRIIAEHVFDGKTEEEVDIRYQNVRIVGNGSFGVVFQIRLVDSGRDAAIKRVLQDKRFKVHAF